MSTLLVWKDQIEKIYARYSFYIVKILQFVLGLCVFGPVSYTHLDRTEWFGKIIPGF